MHFRLFYKAGVLVNDRRWILSLHNMALDDKNYIMFILLPSSAHPPTPEKVVKQQGIQQNKLCKTGRKCQVQLSLA